MANEPQQPTMFSPVSPDRLNRLYDESRARFGALRPEQRILAGARAAKDFDPDNPNPFYAEGLSPEAMRDMYLRLVYTTGIRRKSRDDSYWEAVKKSTGRGFQHSWHMMYSAVPYATGIATGVMKDIATGRFSAPDPELATPFGLEKSLLETLIGVAPTGEEMMEEAAERARVRDQGLSGYSDATFRRVLIENSPSWWKYAPLASEALNQRVFGMDEYEELHQARMDLLAPSTEVHWTKSPLLKTAELGPELTVGLATFVTGAVASTATTGSPWPGIAAVVGLHSLQKGHAVLEATGDSSQALGATLLDFAATTAIFAVAGPAGGRAAKNLRGVVLEREVGRMITAGQGREAAKAIMEISGAVTYGAAIREVEHFAMSLTALALNGRDQLVEREMIDGMWSALQGGAGEGAFIAGLGATMHSVGMLKTLPQAREALLDVKAGEAFTGWTARLRTVTEHAKGTTEAELVRLLDAYEAAEAAHPGNLFMAAMSRRIRGAIEIRSGRKTEEVVEKEIADAERGIEETTLEARTKWANEANELLDSLMTDTDIPVRVRTKTTEESANPDALADRTRTVGWSEQVRETVREIEAAEARTAARLEEATELIAAEMETELTAQTIFADLIGEEVAAGLRTLYRIKRDRAIKSGDKESSAEDTLSPETERVVDQTIRMLEAEAESRGIKIEELKVEEKPDVGDFDPLGGRSAEETVEHLREVLNRSGHRVEIERDAERGTIIRVRIRKDGPQIAIIRVTEGTEPLDINTGGEVAVFDVSRAKGAIDVAGVQSGVRREVMRRLLEDADRYDLRSSNTKDLKERDPDSLGRLLESVERFTDAVAARLDIEFTGAALKTNLTGLRARMKSIRASLRAIVDAEPINWPHRLTEASAARTERGGGGSRPLPDPLAAARETPGAYGEFLSQARAIRSLIDRHNIAAKTHKRNPTEETESRLRDIESEVEDIVSAAHRWAKREGLEFDGESNIDVLEQAYQEFAHRAGKAKPPDPGLGGLESPGLKEHIESIVGMHNKPDTRAYTNAEIMKIKEKTAKDAHRVGTKEGRAEVRDAERRKADTRIQRAKEAAKRRIDALRQRMKETKEDAKDRYKIFRKILEDSGISKARQREILGGLVRSVGGERLFPTDARLKKALDKLEKVVLDESYSASEKRIKQVFNKRGERFHGSVRGLSPVLDDALLSIMNALPGYEAFFKRTGKNPAELKDVASALSRVGKELGIDKATTDYIADLVSEVASVGIRKVAPKDAENLAIFLESLASHNSASRRSRRAARAAIKSDQIDKIVEEITSTVDPASVDYAGNYRDVGGEGMAAASGEFFYGLRTNGRLADILEYMSGGTRTVAYDLLYKRLHRANMEATVLRKAFGDNFHKRLKDAGLEFEELYAMSAAYESNGLFDALVRRGWHRSEVIEIPFTETRTRTDGSTYTKSSPIFFKTGELMQWIINSKDPRTRRKWTDTDSNMRRANTPKAQTMDAERVAAIETWLFTTTTRSAHGGKWLHSQGKRIRRIMDYAEFISDFYNSDMVRQTLVNWHVNKYGWDPTSGYTYAPLRLVRSKGRVKEDVVIDLTEGAKGEEDPLGAIIEMVGMNNESGRSMEPSMARLRRETPSIDDVYIGDALLELNRYIHSLSVVSRVEAPLRNAMKLLRDDRITGEIEVLPAPQRKLWNTITSNFYEPFIREQTGIISRFTLGESFLRKARNNMVRAALALNLPVAVYQKLSLIAAAAEMGPRAWGDALKTEAWFRLPGNKKAVRQRAMDNSPHLWDRLMTSNGTAIATADASLGRGQSVMLGHKVRRGDWGFSLIAAVDADTVLVIYRMAELQALRALNTRAKVAKRGHELTVESRQVQQAASRLAERAVIETQPTFDALNNTAVANLSRTRTPYMIMNSFRGYVSKLVALQRRAIFRADRARKQRGVRAAGAELSKAAVQTMSSTMLIPVIRKLVKTGLIITMGRLLGKDTPVADKELEELWGTELAFDTMGQMLTMSLGGELASGVLLGGAAIAAGEESRRYEPGGTLLSSTSTEFVRAIHQLGRQGWRWGQGKEMDPESLLRGSSGLTRSVGAMAGVPGFPFTLWNKAINEYYHDDTTAPMMISR